MTYVRDRRNAFMYNTLISYIQIRRLIMKFFSYISLLFFVFSFLHANESEVCQKCHPTIYDEYYNSSHRKASIESNPIHKAIWDQHPNKDDGYSCVKCHSPSDKELMKTGILKENKIQKEEPISCIYCHTIKDIEDGNSSNKNILSNKKREFFTAESNKKGSTIAEYKTQSSFFGLIKESKNSPYHRIDYNNENFYSGNVCMGCHSHTNNDHGFDITMLDAVIDKNDKNTCVTCHMPQIQGTKVTLNDSQTHAYHGIAGIHNMNKFMGEFIEFNVEKNDKGFSIKVANKSNHALFGQVFREGILQVQIQRDTKNIDLEPFIFTRVFGKNSKETMPWDATEVIKDTLIYEKKEIMYEHLLQAGDKLRLVLGVKRISDKAARNLKLQDNAEITKLKILKTQSFEF